ncbi:MAG: alpha-L-fucosidase [Clostridiales bacterium]|nr:alpha-L-fucosidase [Clostridiales bacterium]
MKDFLRYAGNVKPTERQLSWFDMEFYAFVHFSPNTYTGLEWGTGKEDPLIFNPTELDCRDWVKAVKSAGMKGLILTAKHHDGFCLWQTDTTVHSMKSSPYKNGLGDVVGEAAKACAEGGIKFGVYLSPWDRNNVCYGTPEYNDFYCAQLAELLTNYGKLFMVWFDGACKEGPNGRRQEYDFDRYISLIRKYQPNAVIFNDHGPDVCWCGNESGGSRFAEWAVVPHELCYRCKGGEDIVPPLCGDLAHMYNSDIDIGALSNILYSSRLVFCGAEIDMSIRPGWFYHESEDPYSLERLFDTYIRSVGGNCCFNLNISPMKNGCFDERDVRMLRELGKLIDKSFSFPLSCSVKRRENGDNRCVFDITLESERKVSYVVLSEDIALGQRVETFTINSGDSVLFRGTTIGHKRICRINKTVQSLRVHISSGRDTVVLRNIAVY